MSQLAGIIITKLQSAIRGGGAGEISVLYFGRLMFFFNELENLRKVGGLWG